MSQETTTKLFFMGFFLHRLAQCAMHMPKLTFWHQDFLNSPRLWKSLRICFSKKVTSHCVHHACFHVCLPNAPDLFVKCSSSHLYFLPGFLSGFTSRCCSSHLDSPGRFPAFQFQGFIWVHQFHLSSRLCVVDFQPTRVFRVLGSGFTSRCCHPATSPLWAMGSGD